jgi:hypothetical protein
LNLDTKVRAFIDNHTALARLWDIEGLNLVFGHDGVYLPVGKCRKTQQKQIETWTAEIAVMKWQAGLGFAVTPLHGRGSTATTRHPSYSVCISLVGSRPKKQCASHPQLRRDPNIYFH